MRLIDISLPLHADMPVYPGDRPTELRAETKPSGSRLTTITMGSHAGTHVDGPSHAGLGEAGTDSFALEAFYGPARVVAIEGASIGVAELETKAIERGDRVLFQTANSTRGYDEFYTTWVGLSAEGAAYLAGIGVTLVGIDWWGIKQPKPLATDNRAHTELLGRGIPILEGLNLCDVDEGRYTLSALPLAFRALDGAPTRAVLIVEE